MGEQVQPVPGTRLKARLAILLVLLLLASAWLERRAAADEPDEYRAARLRMVEEDIEREGITNEVVLQAFRHVPRHLFVGQEDRPKAHHDGSLAIGLKQT